MSNYVKTPTGFMVQGQAGLVPVTDPVVLRDLNSGNTPSVSQTGAADVQSPGQNDSYTKFNTAIMGLLQKGQQAGNPGPLYASRDQMNNQALNLSNPLNSTPYQSLFQGMSPGAALAGQKGTEAAFQPGISSINSQIQSNNDAQQNFNSLAKTGVDMGNLVYQENKPVELSPGNSLVTQQGDVLKQGGKYTPAFNYSKGIMDGFDNQSGTWASDASAGSSPQGGGNSNIIGGVDFSGQSNGVGAYATDPNYANATSSMYASIKSVMPTPSAQAIDQYAAGHASGSKVTGQMIMNAASQYGLDPALLTAVLAHESDFGTAGQASKNNNPGGVVWANQAGAKQGSERPQNEGGYYAAYNSWQQGVNAAASELAKRVPKAAAGGSVSAIGGQFSPIATQKIQGLVASAQPYVDAGPKGIAYINDEKVPQQMKDFVRIQSAKQGIPYVSAADASAIKSLDVVYNNIAQMKELVDGTKDKAGILNPGFMGGVEDFAKTGMNFLSRGNAYPELNKLELYKDTAIKAIQGLAGGAGSGLRITGAEIAAQLSTLPSTTDTLGNADIKIDQVTKFLDQQLAASFPYVKSQTPTTAAPTSSGVTPSGISYKIIQ